MAAIGFPFTVDDTGRVALVRDPVAEARNEVINCVTTSAYTRVMRPNYGGGLMGYLFDTMDESTVADIQHQLTNALTIDVPSVSVHRIGVRPNPVVDGQLDVGIFFSLRRDIESQVYLATVTIDGVVTEEILG